MKITLISKDLSFASIVALPLVERDELARAFVKGNVNLKAVKDDQSEGAKVMGKFLCDLETRLEADRKAMAVKANETLTQYFKDKYCRKDEGGLNSHALSLKNAFGAFVRNGLITENDYDVNSGNCLALASSIVTAVNGDIMHASVKLAAAQLIERSNKEAKNLREILLTVKPAAKMTADEAIETMRTLFADGQLAPCIAVLPDLIMGSEKNPELYPGLPVDGQRAMFGTFAQAVQTFQTRFEAQEAANAQNEAAELAQENAEVAEKIAA